MGMQIRRLRLSVMTENGRFGRDLRFEAGLNVLKVGNASGKSTCIQAIVYALGLESMLSPKHLVPLPHSMLEFLEYGDNRKIKVLESEVFLVVENSEGKVLTIRRTVKSENDNRLVTVWYGDMLENKTSDPGFDYYVRLGGSATKSRGFHSFLSQFLGWTLPPVTKNDGSTCPLYLECIFPLVVVEQKRGWSGIQMAIPLHYGIKAVRQRAVEFTLNLDAQFLVLRKTELQGEIDDLRRNWGRVVAEIREASDIAGGEARNFPASPTTIWPPEVTPTIYFQEESVPQSLQNRIRQERDLLDFIEQEAIPQVEADAARLNNELREQRNRLNEIEVAASSIESEVQDEIAESRLLNRRLESVDKDLREYQDIRRLQSLGSVSAQGVESDNCPTCAQPINDSLLPQGTDLHPLGIDENIEYLRNQRVVILSMLEESEALRKRMSNRSHALQDQASDVRASIRNVKSTLLSSAKAPSEAAIAEKIRKQQLLVRLTGLEEKSEEAIQQLDKLSVIWKELLERKAKLPDGHLSEEDLDKLKELAKLLTSQLVDYDLRSLSPSDFGISHDTYHPIYQEFDLGFDLAASDVIRLVWSYLVGLLEISREYKTNHPGLLVFDEPQQQNINDLSVEALIGRVASCGDFNQQVLLSVSKLPESFSDDKDTINLIDIEGWVLAPLKG